MKLRFSSRYSAWKYVPLGHEIDALSLGFFSYETGIVVYVTINIKCDTLNSDLVIGTYCSTFEQQSDICRIRLKRTIWAASGEPVLEARRNMERLGRRLS